MFLFLCLFVCMLVCQRFPFTSHPEIVEKQTQQHTRRKQTQQHTRKQTQQHTRKQGCAVNPSDFFVIVNTAHPRSWVR